MPATESSQPEISIFVLICKVKEIQWVNHIDKLIWKDMTISELEVKAANQFV